MSRLVGDPRWEPLAARSEQPGVRAIFAVSAVPVFVHLLLYCDARIAVRAVLLLVSFYGATGDSSKLSQQNRDLLDAVANFVYSIGMPFIIGGDFNLEPGVLAGSGWVSAIGGFIASPAGSTCFSASPSTIDYFVLQMLKKA